MNKRFYFLLLIGALYFVNDYIPLQIIIFVGTLICLKVIKQDWSAFYIYPIQGIFIYLLLINFDQFFIPEASVSLLLGLCVIQILYAYRGKEEKFDYLISILFLASLTLFNSTIGFIAYILVCIVIAIVLISEIDILGSINKRFLFKVLINISFLSIITMTLFIFFPRFKGLIPPAQAPRKGEIGYSKEIRNSDISSLDINEKIAFYALMKKVSKKDLYWRARVLNYTDGYNWRASERSILRKNLAFSGKKINYYIKSEQSFYGDIITLDVPESITNSKLSFYSQAGFQTFQSYDMNKKNSFRATSYFTPPKTSISNFERELYLQIPSFIPRKLKELTNNLSNSPSLIINEFKTYLLEEKFSYSISPGPMPTLSSFIEKKKGFCTHYASFLAMILRVKKIPSRIITGFQGGEYNELSNSYTVKSSDAHAWVEYWDNRSWKRVDPTSFVAPNRVFENYRFNNEGSVVKKSSSFQFLNRLGLIYESLNVNFSFFIDNLDQSFQKDMAKKFKISLANFYLYGLFILLALVGLIYFFNIKRLKKAPIDEAFDKFSKKLLKDKINIYSTDNLEEIRKKVFLLPDKKRERALTFLSYYERIKYKKN